MHTIFIDGSQGTTGLRIVQRLSLREDIKILSLLEEKRKDPSARKEMLNACDIALLCLPDAAAIEAADMVENPKVRVLDTSTAHRTDPDWVYGLPELSADHRTKILESRRIAVPGCHASGFITLVYPLVEAGILKDKDDPSSLISRINVQEAPKMIAEGVISGGMIPKVEGCCNAVKAGVKKVFIIDGRVKHSILIELLTDEGMGTMFQ